MREPARKPATYEDLRSLTDQVIGQIIDGELSVMPRPAPAHARASSILGMDIGGPFDRGRGGPGGWHILDEPELHLRRDVLVPDLAGWRRARMPSMPSTPYFELAPDWVCEIVSPSSSSIDRVAKRHLYAREGIGYYWLIDPLAKTLEALKLEGTKWLEVGAWAQGMKARIEPFDAIELDLDALWPEGPATEPAPESQT